MKKNEQHIKLEDIVPSNFQIYQNGYDIGTDITNNMYDEDLESTDEDVFLFKLGIWEGIHETHWEYKNKLLIKMQEERAKAKNDFFNNLCWAMLLNEIFKN